MSKLFKDLYDEPFFKLVADVASGVIPGFDKSTFWSQIFIPEFASLELKQRTSHTAKVLGYYLPDEFEQVASIILQMVERFESRGVQLDSLPYLFLPEIVEQRGQEHLEQSAAVIERLTQFITCEFAVRPFIANDQSAMLAHMNRWTTHSHRRVRRLASEGARPRLPWGMALSELKQQPEPLRPILLALRDDECEWVRKSVANNLNDIAKDNPQWVIEFAQRHIGETEHTDKVIKHACRTLLKQADPVVLELFGYDSEGLAMQDFTLKESQVLIGDSLSFQFVVKNHSPRTKKLRMEYGLYYLKANGQHGKKVFKISERSIPAQTEYKMTRQHSFKPVSTRTLYPGQHQVTVIINGAESEPLMFDLTASH